MTIRSRRQYATLWNANSYGAQIREILFKTFTVSYHKDNYWNIFVFVGDVLYQKGISCSKNDSLVHSVKRVTKIVLINFISVSFLQRWYLGYYTVYMLKWINSIKLGSKFNKRVTSESFKINIYIYCYSFMCSEQIVHG